MNDDNDDNDNCEQQTTLFNHEINTGNDSNIFSFNPKSFSLLETIDNNLNPVHSYSIQLLSTESGSDSGIVCFCCFVSMSKTK
jgi:uncharacterized Zn-finger protein